ncbi:MAG TPA: glycosyltransferase family 39 protein [Vicinamibacterales bacterium]|nr:glycosyltransferase family 39 protein [Vicinamibacterales bacterium]
MAIQTAAITADQERASHRRLLLRAGPVARIVMAAVGFRLFSALLAFLANVVFPDYQREGFTMWGRTNLFWDTFTRYDSGWYYGIARSGYDVGPALAGGRSNIAFFPVYPLLMRYVGRLFGRAPGDVYLGGIVVAWVCFVLAMVGLYHLARLDVSGRRAERAVLAAAVFPFAFFHGVAYSESTFLLFTVASFYFFRTARWIPAGLCGAVATATRVNGIFMLPAVAWLAWHRAGPILRDRLLAAFAVALVASGFGAYCLYVYLETGHPLMWATALQRWGYYPGGAPWTAPIDLVRALLTRPYAFLVESRLAPYDALNGLTAIACLVSMPFVWRRLGAAYGLFILANLWLPLSSGQFEGLGRYCAVLFPTFIWLATLRSRFVFESVIVVFAALYTLCLALFTNIHPLF